MKFHSKIDWQNPEKIAFSLAKENDYFAFLFSSEQRKYSGNFSYIAWGRDSEINNNLSKLKKALSSNLKFHENFWLGYFSYEKDLYFFKPQNLLIFNHKNKSIEYFSCDNKPLNFRETTETQNNFQIKNISSNMSKKSYIEYVEKIREKIKEGEFGQANLTRKFFGKIENFNAFSIFLDLKNNSPAPYSAFIKLKDKYIISSSPERFIHIDKNGQINTRPIKGTIDNKSPKNLEKLKNSKKDKAENLMITDLMRNDLSQTAKNVKVSDLFQIDSYKTLHHMSSNITAEKQNDKSSFDVIFNSLPPGSMTGTPKIKVIEVLKELEKEKRGIYSGTIGYFAGDGSCDFSVVIRTIIIENKKFEFQVGGAIIYESKANLEWKETLTKASAIAKTLNIAIKDLENL